MLNSGAEDYCQGARCSTTPRARLPPGYSTFSFGKPLEPGDSIPAGTTFRIQAGEEFRSLSELNGSSTRNTRR